MLTICHKNRAQNLEPYYPFLRAATLAVRIKNLLFGFTLLLVGIVCVGKTKKKKHDRQIYKS